ncbi:MAG: phosphoribosylformylglycinamidine synthase, partial [Candidatus Omnitrophica bacterium]|nr:phosphoribosylformylglycinamidine synthase [Candidatus Omnitrophota bacterium]
NPRLGAIDPYWMAASAVDEAVRQIISVGGDISRIALLDNFCWGNPDKPDRLGGLVRAAKGCHDIAVAYGTPFISGKDSFYNEYNDKGKSIAIPGTILLSAIGIVEDVNRSVTMDLKKVGGLLYVVGSTYDEWGASAYLAAHGYIGGQVPVVRPREALATYIALAKAVATGLAAAVHDCSEGGVAVAVAEMAFAGGLGAALLLKSVPYEGHANRDDMVWFAESNSRFVVEVAPADQAAFEKVMRDVPCKLAGQVLADEAVFYYGLKDNLCLKADINVLKEAWQKPLRF